MYASADLELLCPEVWPDAVADYLLAHPMAICTALDQQFRESCEALFEVPEIRRACFENMVAFNAINGEFCRIHSPVGIPLPVKGHLDGEEGTKPLRFK